VICIKLLEPVRRNPKLLKTILICLIHSFRGHRLEILILGRILIGLEEIYMNSGLGSNCKLLYTVNVLIIIPVVFTSAEGLLKQCLYIFFVERGLAFSNADNFQVLPFCSYKLACPFTHYTCTSIKGSSFILLEQKDIPSSSYHRHFLKQK
jgi:hypothetical protein